MGGPLNRRRHEVQQTFLAILATTGNQSATCQQVGITPRTTYQWRKKDASFADAYEQALIRGKEAVRRAHLEDDKLCPACNQWKHSFEFPSGKVACRLCVNQHRRERYTPTGRMPTSAFVDRTGERFGKLTILSYVGRNRWNKRLWECQCDCGNIVHVLYASLRNGDTISCGCSRHERAGLPAYNRKPFGESSFRMLYGAYKHSAKQRGHAFDLDEEAFRELTQSPCFYCGCPPSQAGRTVKGSYGAYIYTGVDRIDNAQGYIKENVRPCCKQCNVAKGMLAEQDFLDWVRRVAERLFSNELPETTE